MAVRFSIVSQASSPISEAITTLNKNIKNNQVQGMSAKMTTNGIQTHACTNQ